MICGFAGVNRVAPITRTFTSTLSDTHVLTFEGILGLLALVYRHEYCILSRHCEQHKLNYPLTGVLHGMIYVCVRGYSHQAIVGAKAKTVKEQA